MKKRFKGLWEGKRQLAIWGNLEICAIMDWVLQEANTDMELGVQNIS